MGRNAVRRWWLRAVRSRYRIYTLVAFSWECHHSRLHSCHLYCTAEISFFPALLGSVFRPLQHVPPIGVALTTRQKHCFKRTLHHSVHLPKRTPRRALQWRTGRQWPWLMIKKSRNHVENSSGLTGHLAQQCSENVYKVDAFDPSSSLYNPLHSDTNVAQNHSSPNGIWRNSHRRPHRWLRRLRPREPHRTRHADVAGRPVFAQYAGSTTLRGKCSRTMFRLPANLFNPTHVDVQDGSAYLPVVTFAEGTGSLGTGKYICEDLIRPLPDPRLKYNTLVLPGASGLRLISSLVSHCPKLPINIPNLSRNLCGLSTVKGNTAIARRINIARRCSLYVHDCLCIFRVPRQTDGTFTV